MALNLTLVAVAAFLIAGGVYLILERSLTRILIGIMLASNGVNTLFMAIGEPGLPALVGLVEPDEMSDPLPQAMVLTAIVITLASVAYLLSMAYRAFQLEGNDEVRDDIEDSQIRQLAELEEASESFDSIDTPDTDTSVVDDDDEHPLDPEDRTGETHDEDALGEAAEPDGSAEDAGATATDVVGSEEAATDELGTPTSDESGETR
ncbi:Na(+)/H(+) antiporter subunit C [Parenemella sanctibonifatiensis]|uniref:Na(+)/H(+) antiporter subunit C n=1 Tax=Parenemella sanctibonifatiensis TaxID=2016505 RepID=A0A255EJA4_9ACTN|nr:Na(+)/H(+) antiporter subunit C [Parenemella sanctibonifatiensis]OYN89512.1 Na(+)/H(+) antiporter subunit C [Parenemella sanctibonifatiensis]